MKGIAPCVVARSHERGKHAHGRVALDETTVLERTDVRGELGDCHAFEQQ